MQPNFTRKGPGRIAPVLMLRDPEKDRPKWVNQWQYRLLRRKPPKLDHVGVDGRPCSVPVVEPSDYLNSNRARAGL